MLAPEDFPTDEHREVWQVLREFLDRKEPIDLGVLAERVSPDAREVVAELALDRRLLEDIERNVAGGVLRLMEARLQRREQALVERLRRAGGEGEREALQRELTEVRRERSELAGRRTVDAG